MDPGYLNLLLNLVTVMFTGGALGFVLRYRHGMKALTNAEAADIREHYAEELQRVIDRQHACEAREEALRKRVAELENDVLGLIRIIGQASADKVIELGSGVPEDIRQIAERLVRRDSQ